ncbi:MAG: hypothetical protein PHX83_03220 [Acidobacteriia bacterium]|nr:hypothetical protein [Terriglobia bacterium]
MKTTIYFALTHDWELRGDGSGDIEQIQFAPMRKLLKIYAKFGARVTFLPDLMQQLSFRRLEGKHPELKRFADRWDEHVRETFLRGHDVQLHLHPQWLNAEYENGRWCLKGDWSILTYDREAAYAMIAEGRQYLENLLRPLDAAYRCVAFRAGALAAAPSDHLLKSLADLGLQLDVSTVGGLFVSHGHVQLDYRHCEETFLPFYPLMEDARKVSDKHEPIVCVPIHHFYGSRRAVTQRNLSLAWREVRRHRRGVERPGSAAPVNGRLRSEPSRIGQVYTKLILPLMKRTHFVSDTGNLNYPLMIEMLKSIREQAEASGLAELPVMLTNHPKDIRDINAIEHLLAEVSRTEGFKFITLAEMAEKLRGGAFYIRRRDNRETDNK